MENKYRRFSDEQIAVANSVSLVDYLLSIGEGLTKSGKEMRWNRYSSVTIDNNRYYKWKTQEGGYPIQFLKEFYGYNFKQAMELLLSFAGDNGMTVSTAPEKEVKKEFILPERNETMRRVYGYLLNTRFIDRDVLNTFAEAKLIYEDRPYHNAVFVGYDESGTARHAHKKSTLTKSGFRGNVEGSDPRYTFYYSGTDSQIYVFEAPIDMLSYITLNKENWQEHSYIALNGLGIQGLEHQLDIHKDIDNVFLCFDHDTAGMEANERVRDLLGEREGIEVSTIQSGNKDFNEDLKEIHGVEFLEAVSNPKLKYLHEVYDEVFQMIKNECRDITLQDLRKEFASLYYSRNKKANDFDFLKDRLLHITAYSERIRAELYGGYDENYGVKKEDMSKTLISDYRCYRDKGNLEKRISELMKCMEEIKDMPSYADDKRYDDALKKISVNALTHLNAIERKRRMKMEQEKKQGLDESLRPNAKMIGEDGNVFNLMGICSRKLKKAGYPEKAEEMLNRVTSCGSYDEALSIMSEYVNPVGDEQEHHIEFNGY